MLEWLDQTREGPVYDFRAQGIGRDADGRPDVAPPSWFLTAGELVRFPTEYAASWLVDRLPAAHLGRGRAGRPPAGRRPRARAAGARAAGLRGHRPVDGPVAVAPRPVRLDDLHLGSG